MFAGWCCFQCSNSTSGTDEWVNHGEWCLKHNSKAADPGPHPFVLQKRMQDGYRKLDEKVNYISKVVKVISTIATAVGIYKLMTWITKLRRKMIKK